MPKKIVNVKQHKRKLESGKITNVKQHKRRLDNNLERINSLKTKKEFLEKLLDETSKYTGDEQKIIEQQFEIINNSLNELQSQILDLSDEWKMEEEGEWSIEWRNKNNDAYVVVDSEVSGGRGGPKIYGWYVKANHKHINSFVSYDADDIDDKINAIKYAHDFMKLTENKSKDEIKKIIKEKEREHTNR